MIVHHVSLGFCMFMVFVFATNVLARGCRRLCVFYEDGGAPCPSGAPCPTMGMPTPLRGWITPCCLAAIAASMAARCAGVRKGWLPGLPTTPLVESRPICDPQPECVSLVSKTTMHHLQIHHTIHVSNQYGFAGVAHATRDGMQPCSIPCALPALQQPYQTTTEPLIDL